MQVAVIDIGKPEKNLGWAIRGENVSREGVKLDECIEALSSAMRDGPLALGFEAPLFVPVRSKPADLTKARDGECENGVNRPFSAGAGAAVLVTALTIVPYVLNSLKKTVPDVQATLNWRSPLSDNGLLLFEAFVSNQRRRHKGRHVEDALAAISAFRRAAASAEFESHIKESHCFNLLGAMLLRTGWMIDPAILSEPCLVIKSDQRDLVVDGRVKPGHDMGG